MREGRILGKRGQYNCFLELMRNYVVLEALEIMKSQANKALRLLITESYL